MKSLEFRQIRMIPKRRAVLPRSKFGTLKLDAVFARRAPATASAIPRSLARLFGRVVASSVKIGAAAMITILVLLPAFQAFEAHIINVTAELRQIDPPILTPPGGPPTHTWDDTNGGTGLTGTVNVVMTDPDPDATHIFYTSGAGTNPASVSEPVCGQPVVPGSSGGGQIPIEIVQLSLTSDTVIKAIGCDGNTGSAHKSVTNTKIYDFQDLDAPVADDYSPIADAFVEQDHASTNNGSDDKLEIKSKSSNKNERTYIRFDFLYPLGTTISSSSLNLFMKDAPGSSRTYEAKKATSAWTESGINWSNQPTFNGSPTDSVSSGTTNNVWRSWNVLTDVQSFVATPSSNYGWELNDSVENTGDNRARFISRDKTGADEPHRPYLEVNFTAPSATTTHLVINEVYPIVGNGKGTEASNEWVEIYNPTGSSVDISGWQICDATSCDTIPAATPVIPSYGFALIANVSTTWSSFWPGTPAGAVKIGLGTTIGSNGLDNAGDRVILKDGTVAHNIVDAMSYGTDTTYMTLTAPKVGISLARIVKGYDTDSATDWVYNATPNPGTNPSGTDGAEVMRFTSDGIQVAASEAGLPPIGGDEEQLLDNLEPITDNDSHGPEANQSSDATSTAEVLDEQFSSEPADTSTTTPEELNLNEENAPDATETDNSPASQDDQQSALPKNDEAILPQHTNQPDDGNLPPSAPTTGEGPDPEPTPTALDGITAPITVSE